jgi:hypothetical protein
VGKVLWVWCNAVDVSSTLKIFFCYLSKLVVSASRMCLVHNNNGVFDPSQEFFLHLRNMGNHLPLIFVDQSDIIALMIEVSAFYYKMNETTKQKLNFDDMRLSNNDYMTFTGLKKSQFDSMIVELPLRDCQTWSKRNSLGVYLTRIRCGQLLCCVLMKILICVRPVNWTTHVFWKSF